MVLWSEETTDGQSGDVNRELIGTVHACMQSSMNQVQRAFLVTKQKIGKRGSMSG